MALLYFLPSSRPESTVNTHEHGCIVIHSVESLSIAVHATKSLSGRQDTIFRWPIVITERRAMQHTIHSGYIFTTLVSVYLVFG